MSSSGGSRNRCMVGDVVERPKAARGVGVGCGEEYEFLSRVSILLLTRDMI